MARRGDCPPGCKIYVGGLPERASRSELEEIFNRYGSLRTVWVARRPPGFAFVEFDDARDAEEAARALDGTRMCGVRARVEISNDDKRNGGRGRSGPLPRGRYDNAYDSRDRDRRPRSPAPYYRRSRSRSRSPYQARRYSPARRRRDSRSLSPRMNGRD